MCVQADTFDEYYQWYILPQHGYYLEGLPITYMKIPELMPKILIIIGTVGALITLTVMWAMNRPFIIGDFTSIFQRLYFVFSSMVLGGLIGIAVRQSVLNYKINAHLFNIYRPAYDNPGGGGVD